MITEKYLKCVFLHTGNSCGVVNDISGNILQRCSDAIEMGQLDIILDLREENTGRPLEEKFKAFWDALEKIINQITAEDDRRQGGGIAHLSTFISIRSVGGV